jgi:hypothetical protein
MRDEVALAAVAEFLATLRDLFPGRCYAQRRTARPGQFWIADDTGRPPYTTARVYVRAASRSALITTIRILGPETIRVSMPYSDRETVQAMTKCKAIQRGRRVALDKLDAAHAREAAHVIRQLVDLGLARLPAIAEVDVLSAWRIL